MSRPGDSTAAPAATLDVARSRANTGASLSAAPYGTSYRSTTGSSVVSNGSLLDLYARSSGSFPGSIDASANTDATFSAAPAQPSASSASSSGIPVTSTAGFSIPPSDSNASVWTTASAPATESLPHSKRASVAGFDIDVMRSVQPAHDTGDADLADTKLPLPPRIGLEVPQDDSDGSHYDDDEVPGAFSYGSFDHPADRTIEPPLHRNTAAAADDVQTDEVLPSPPVPRRTSSVMHDSYNTSPSPSQMDDLVRIDSSLTRHAASRSGSGQLASEQIPQRQSSADIRDEAGRRQFSTDPSMPSQESFSSRTTANAVENGFSTASRNPVGPTKGITLHAVDENLRLSTDKTEGESRTSNEPSIDEQMRLERELLSEADDSRPRTLKEARERAKMRRQQSDTVVPPSTSANPLASAAVNASPRKRESLHVRNVASSATAAAADDDGSRASIDSRDRPVRNPKRISRRDSALAAEHRSLSERSAASDYSHDSGAEAAFAFDELGVSSGEQAFEDADLGQQTTNMDDLTDAVNNAMNDLSFGSADETLSADDEFATPLPPSMPQNNDRPNLPISLPSALSLANVTRSNQNDAQDASRSSTLASPAKHAPTTPKASTLPSFVSSQSLGTPPLGSPAQQRTAPVTSTTQRATHSLPSRIDVYGKTLPMPRAFVSSGIIVDKRRMSSWERARTYAAYTNDLLHLQTSLSLWMEAVQRPAMRQQNNRPKQSDDWLTQGTLPRSTHVRNEGSYADSIRSDMTFPMRGDGAKAKEIVSVLPTMAESPVHSAVNLPYPGVVSQQQPRANSTQSFSSISATDSLGGVSGGGRNSGMGGGNRFFSGLGRMGSKRAQPTATPASNVSASSALSSISVAVGGSRAYLTNSRNKRTASPGIAGAGSGGSLPSKRPSTDTVETSYSSYSRPESPATGPVRVAGLGLGAAGGETPTGAGASASTGRLDAVREVRIASSGGGTSFAVSGTGTSGTTGLRAPFGPRAPNSGASGKMSNDMKRTGSGHSQTTPVTPITPITPISPMTGGFGSGPTFVSRLGGGLHSPLSPGRDGYSSPEFLNPPRRQSDLTSSSPPLPTQDASPRLNVGLRSSLSHGSVRDQIRRGSSPGPEDEAFNEALIKLGDIFPDADMQTLRFYLNRAKGNDLAAIGDYLQDQSLGKLPRFT